MSLFEQQADSLGGLYGAGRAKRKRGRGSRRAGRQEPRDLRRTAPSVNLSPDQRAVVEAVDAWLLDESPALSLAGYAGTGKSTTLKVIAKAARDKLWTVRLSAATHKAAASVRLATGLHCSTAHRVLGVSLINDNDTGETKVRRGRPEIDSRTFLVIDEAYMLPDWMVDLAVKACKKHGAKVLFVGDPGQLAPVKAKASDALDPDRCAWPVHTLTEVHRQAADNPIIAAATAVRLADPKALPRLETATDEHGHGIVVMTDKRAWRDLLVEHCAREDEENRYLGWTNRAVDAAARAIRREQFGDRANAAYVAGERLVVNDRCVVRERAVDKGRKDPTKIVIENNDEIDILQVHEDGAWWHLLVRAGTEQVVLTAASDYLCRARHLESWARQCRGSGSWQPFFEQKELVADLRPATAATVHRSQGSTFDDVFINAEELANCNDPVERRRLWYVALTRASRTVYVYDGRLA